MITEGQKQQLIAYMQEIIDGLELVTKRRDILKEVLASIEAELPREEISAALENMPEFKELLARTEALMEGLTT